MVRARRQILPRIQQSHPDRVHRRLLRRHRGRSILGAAQLAAVAQPPGGLRVDDDPRS